MPLGTNIAQSAAVRLVYEKRLFERVTMQMVELVQERIKYLVAEEFTALGPYATWKQCDEVYEQLAEKVIRELMPGGK